MILFLILANVSFPASVNILYAIFLPVASFDLIPPEYSTDLIFTFSEEDKKVSNKLEDLGFETHNMIYNLGVVFYMIWFTVVIIVFTSFIRIYKF